MPAVFDKKAYMKQIESLSLDNIQDCVSAIDERTFSDLKKREILIERRKALALPMFEAASCAEVPLEHWVFRLTQMQKPSVPSIIVGDEAVFKYILETHPEWLSISKENLIKALVELKMSDEDIKAFISAVCICTSPTVTAKRIP